MVYWTAARDETTERMVDPYHLALIGDSWYLIGYCHWRREVLTFATARVRSARLTEEAFKHPAISGSRTIWQAVFACFVARRRHWVVLRFGREVAGRVKEKIWHTSQKTETAGDGGLIVRFQVSDLREVLGWALSWGADCEVLEPGEFREMMKREVAELGIKYRE